MDALPHGDLEKEATYLCDKVKVQMGSLREALFALFGGWGLGLLGLLGSLGSLGLLGFLGFRVGGLGFRVLGSLHKRCATCGKQQ